MIDSCKEWTCLIAKGIGVPWEPNVSPLAESFELFTTCTCIVRDRGSRRGAFATWQALRVSMSNNYEMWTTSKATKGLGFGHVPCRYTDCQCPSMVSVLTNNLLLPWRRLRIEDCENLQCLVDEEEDASTTSPLLRQWRLLAVQLTYPFLFYGFSMAIKIWGWL